jgi:hypothetical protein
MSDFHVTRTCAECPWLTASPLGHFAPERYYALARTCTPGYMGDEGRSMPPVFACHMTSDGKERACAGMLLVCGEDNNMVRLASAQGRCARRDLEAPSGPLYPSYLAMALANGCDPDHPALRGLPREEA